MFLSALTCSVAGASVTSVTTVVTVCVCTPAVVVIALFRVSGRRSCGCGSDRSLSRQSC